MPSDNITAIQRSTEAADVVDKIAQHLGDAAGVLGAKVSQIVEQYGPNAASLIREIGRVQAMSQIGYLVLFSGLFTLFFNIFLKAWKKYDEAIVEAGGSLRTSYGETTMADSTGFRMMVFGALSVFCFFGILVNFSMAAIYGVFSPEAYLVVKLLKW